MKKSLYAFCAAISLLLAACSGGSSGSSDPAIPDKTGNGDLASCELKSDAGDAGDSQLLEREMIATGNFGKGYYSNWLEAVLKTSGVETIRLVTQAGVNIYKGKHNKKGCSFFAGLVDAPTDLQAEWDRAQRANENAILGLYLPPDAGINSIAQTPAIIMREKTDRYTLVHEFFHHNFSRHRSDKIENVQDPRKEFIKLVDKIDGVANAYKRSRTAENAKAYVDLALNVATVADEFMVEYTLEEVSIEVELGKKYKSGELKYVSKLSRENGRLYLLSSIDGVGGYKDRWQTFTKAFSDTNRDIGLDWTNRQKIEGKFNEYYRLRTDELNIILRSVRGYGAGGLVNDGSAPKTISSPCGRDHEVDEVMIKFKKRFESFQ